MMVTIPLLLSSKLQLALMVCVRVTFLGIIPGARKRMASNTHLFINGQDFNHS